MFSLFYVAVLVVQLFSKIITQRISFNIRLLCNGITLVRSFHLPITERQIMPDFNQITHVLFVEENEEHSTRRVRGETHKQRRQPSLKNRCYSINELLFFCLNCSYIKAVVHLNSSEIWINIKRELLGFKWVGNTTRQLIPLKENSGLVGDCLVSMY